MAFSIRLDADTERALARLAQERRQTKSTILREALAAYERESRATARPRTPWEALAPFVGAVHSGGSHRSANTGDGFRALVKEKARARRAR